MSMLCLMIAQHGIHVHASIHSYPGVKCKLEKGH